MRSNDAISMMFPARMKLSEGYSPSTGVSERIVPRMKKHDVPTPK